MLKFYKRTLILFIVVVFLTAFFLFAGAVASRIELALFPVDKKTIPWTVDKEPITPTSKTYLNINKDASNIDYTFGVTSEMHYPYAAYILNFLDALPKKEFIDLSMYEGVSFRAQCEPKIVLVFSVYTFDEVVTVVEDTSTHRLASAFFTCDKEGTEVEIKFDELEASDWWLQKFDLELTDQGYQRKKVSAFRFSNSVQTPRDTPLHTEISSIVLFGRAPFFVYLSYMCCFLIWGGYFFWLFRQYVAALVERVKEKVRLDLPLVAYQKLSIAPHRDKEKDEVLRFMATEYSNPELNIENAISALGYNRHKVNDIIRAELGLTFSSYLNKLRLTEAARLLSEQSKISVAEVAYAVGYNNVSYFSTLFKAEYGCSPKTFKNGVVP